MACQVLIADASPAMRALVRRVPDLSGSEVRRRLEAANGRKALEDVAARGPFQLQEGPPAGWLRLERAG